MDFTGVGGTAKPRACVCARRSADAHASASPGRASHPFSPSRTHSGRQPISLAITGTQRVKLFPDVPTTAESGYPYAVLWLWFAVPDGCGKICRRVALRLLSWTARGLSIFAISGSC